MLRLAGVSCQGKNAMAGTVKEAKIHNPTARRRLRPGRQPHWVTLIAGRDHLGWQRRPEDASGRWLLRRRRGGHYSIEPLGIADDREPADGLTILSFEQARSRAVELSMHAERPAGRITVHQAMANYINDLAARGRTTKAAESAAVCHILPKLGHLEVASLTSSQLQAWTASMVEINIPAENNDEMIRRRRVSANRYLSVLKSALNFCFDEGHVSSNLAWGRRVKMFTNVASSRARALSVEECKRLLAGCDDVFKPLATAALQTGMRFGELARLVVSDFNKEAGTLHVRKSKTGRSRHVILTEEGTSFFSDATAGRSSSELIFVTETGKAWSHGNQDIYMRRVNERANIVPRVRFHDLRHTWISLSVMAGIPLTVIAKQVGHTTTKMIETVYGHLAHGFVKRAIRDGAPRFI
jgi:integrase